MACIETKGEEIEMSVFTKEMILRKATRVSSYEFTKKYPKAFKVASRKGLIIDVKNQFPITSHVRGNWTNEKLLVIAKNYKSFDQFSKNSKYSDWRAYK